MSKKNGKVLVIDDSEPILFLLENILSPQFEVVSVNKAKKALDIMDDSYDSIIIDLMMYE